MRSSDSPPRRWLNLALGVGAVVLGAAITLKPYDSLDTLVLIVALGLVLTGVGDLLDHGADHMRAPRWLQGLALVAAGVTVLILPDMTVRVVAITAGIGLVLSGSVRFLDSLRQGADERFTPLVGGLAAILLGVTALAWRDITVLVVALLVGPTLVIVGIGRIQAVLVSGSTLVITLHGSSTRRAGRWLRMAGATLALTVALLLAGISAFLHRGEPEADAFYRAPANVPAEPGQLLRSEAFTRGLPEGAEAVRILYTTTRSDGTPGVASGLVLWSEGLPDGPRPVLAWAHGTTGVAETCAPSLLADPFAAGAMPALDDAIQRGWVIVATDYIGLGTEGPHPYLIGKPAAHAVLDSVRAARQMDAIALSDTTVVWGHSQGGAAALWTGIEAGPYAPDVPLAGVAALAPAGDLPALVGGFGGNPGGALISAFLLRGYDAIYDDVHIEDYVHSSAMPVLDEVADRCFGEPAILVSVGELLIGEPFLTSELDQGPLAARLEENVPDDVTGLPTFFGQGLTDDLVLADPQAAFVEELCERGQVIEYHVYGGRDHVGVVENDSPLIPNLLAWTEARFAGEDAPTACSTSGD